MENLSDKTSVVRSYFDGIAGRYDLMNTLLSFGLHHTWKRKTLNVACLRDSMRILDVCGGTGDLAARAARRLGPGGSVTLYDFSCAMMHAGRTRARQPRTLHYVCGDARSLALKDRSVDAVLIGFGLRNLADMHAGLTEFHRVLTPGGRLVCLEFSQPAGWLLRRLYDLYSYRVIPVLGGLITGSRQAYTYLPDSIREFPPPQQLRQMMEQAGFSSVSCSLLTGGIAALHTGIKA
jgi:demethylmenaquinone methyltransferase / 2-methoxy-6-polyprenyl-1,4-benzoquinol methylase